MAKIALGLVLVLVAVAAVTWPRINDVETGRTPEYPDLKVREYRQSEDAVAQAARAVVGRLPRWTFVAAGKGPGGSEVQAVARVPVGFKQDVTIRIRRQGGATRVSVRSRSRVGKWDFGQNARNIRAFLAALDRDVS